MARWIIIAGCVLVGIGLILHFAPWIIHWIGRLPGDIRIETERSKVFIPITSMIIISLILSLLIHLLKR